MLRAHTSYISEFHANHVYILNLRPKYNAEYRNKYEILSCIARKVTSEIRACEKLFKRIL